MKPPYITPADPTLPHQVVFFVESKHSRVHVSCNCLTNERGGHDSMGESHDIERARRLYNNPTLHRKPFGKEDEAKW